MFCNVNSSQAGRQSSEASQQLATIQRNDPNLIGNAHIIKSLGTKLGNIHEDKFNVVNKPEVKINSPEENVEI
jgi:hypothetical protein